MEECSITGAQDEVFVINDFERTLPPDGISVQHLRQLVQQASCCNLNMMLYARCDLAAGVLLVKRLQITDVARRRWFELTRPLRDIAASLKRKSITEQLEILQQDPMAQQHYLAWEAATSRKRASAVPVWRAVNNLGTQFFRHTSKSAAYVRWGSSPRRAGLPEVAILAIVCLAGSQVHPGQARRVLSCLYETCGVSRPEYRPPSRFDSKEFSGRTAALQEDGLEQMRQSRQRKEKVGARTPGGKRTNKRGKPRGDTMCHPVFASSLQAPTPVHPLYFFVSACCMEQLRDSTHTHVPLSLPLCLGATKPVPR